MANKAHLYYGFNLGGDHNCYDGIATIHSSGYPNNYSSLIAYG